MPSWHWQRWRRLPGGSPSDRDRFTTGSVKRGVAWLVERTECGRRFPTSPIGLYFAKLWYSERLYPMIFAVGALERACTFLAGEPSPRDPLAIGP